jgi:hypothetical protein
LTSLVQRQATPLTSQLRRLRHSLKSRQQLRAQTAASAVAAAEGMAVKASQVPLQEEKLLRHTV